MCVCTGVRMCAHYMHRWEPCVCAQVVHRCVYTRPCAWPCCGFLSIVSFLIDHESCESVSPSCVTLSPSAQQQAPGLAFTWPEQTLRV